MFVRNKATVNAPWLWYTQPSLCQGHWCTRTPMATLGTAGLLVYIQRGALTLFVPTCRAIPGASERGASDSAGLHVFFCVFILPCLIIFGCCSPRPWKMEMTFVLSSALVSSLMSFWATRRMLALGLSENLTDVPAKSQREILHCVQDDKETGWQRHTKSSSLNR